MIPGFRRDVNDVFALLRSYAALIGSLLTDVLKKKIIGPIFKGREIQEKCLLGP